MPKPQTIATWKIPTCAPVSTAAATEPQPKNTSRKVPTNSPTSQAGSNGFIPVSSTVSAFHSRFGFEPRLLPDLPDRPGLKQTGLGQGAEKFRATRNL